MARAKHVTIQQVAEEAGVSIQTVSRVINNRSDVSEETRQRIREIMGRLNYQPFAIARGLASNRTYTLGLVTVDFADPWFSQVVTGAEQEAHEQGYCFMLGSSACNPTDEPKFLRLLTERHVDGILFVRASCAEESKHLLRMKEMGVPVVTTGFHPRGWDLTVVDVANVGGARKATEYLIGLGHRQIAMITGPLDWNSAHDRKDGYIQALEANGISPNSQLIVEASWLHKDGYVGMKTLLERGAPFTAIFAQNDRLARGAISALHERGLRVPEDISIIGYDDIPEAEFSDPPLTTVRQPMRTIGEAATRLLIQMIENRETTSNQVLFDTELIVRSSCTHPA